MQTAKLLLTKIIEKSSYRSCAICPCTTLIILPKTWVDGQIPEPYAIIKPIIYFSFLTCLKNMKKIMAWASTLIEPLLMILIALGVLGFLLSMYLPLFRMAERF